MEARPDAIPPRNLQHSPQKGPEKLGALRSKDRIRSLDDDPVCHGGRHLGKVDHEYPVVIGSLDLLLRDRSRQADRPHELPDLTLPAQVRLTRNLWHQL